MKGSSSKSNTNPAHLPPQRNIFDPWNSSSTGHQVSDSSLSRSTGWRQTRTQKLAKQFRSSTGGGNVVVAGNPAGKRAAGEWNWISEEDAKKAEWGCEDIRGFMGGERKRKIGSGFGGKDDDGGGDRKRIGIVDVERRDGLGSLEDNKPSPKREENVPPLSSQLHITSNNKATLPTTSTATAHTNPTPQLSSTSTSTSTTTPGIFTNLTIYINGSTSPLISDHKLKHLLASNGASIAISLGRRTVTHVILGTPSSSHGSGSGSGAIISGAGGGLAAGKLQKEIMKKNGGGGAAGVKFVGVEWVLESLKARKRLPESNFSNLHIAPKGQRSVMSMFASSSKKG
ncbi:hypothetical protein FQN54_000866 [Arachnomyces sp. PD_36]|nr:hypothetical protein FQN54_000866 [Arachnomyces sp. PD_36]